MNTNMDSIDSELKTLADAVAAGSGHLPVGSLYFNASDATNPATLLGYGTWTSFGAGRVILGVGTGTDVNGATLNVTVGATGGEYSHTLSTGELPSHTHTVKQFATGTTGGTAGGVHLYAKEGDTTDTTGSTGSGTAHNVTQPYIGVYVWLRTL
jgi:hypothetical protein